MDIEQLLQKIKQGDRRSIAKAITLLESSREIDFEIKNQLMKKIQEQQPDKKSLRIAFSGITGSGKSSLIEKVGMHFLSSGKKVAVLAIDPSSPITGGSLLGDKTRMEKLSNSPNAFVRPSPNKMTAGGVGLKTRESILLLEHAGYEIIIIETVGVGQSEVDAYSMADIFSVLLLPSTGDELQGAKKGINELADFILINKADGALKVAAENTQREYQQSIHDSEKVLLCSTHDQSLLDEFIQKIKQFETEKSAHIIKKRKKQKSYWLKSLLRERAFFKLDLIQENVSEFSDQEIYSVAEDLWNKFISSKN